MVLSRAILAKNELLVERLDVTMVTRVNVHVEIHVTRVIVIIGIFAHFV